MKPMYLSSKKFSNYPFISQRLIRLLQEIGVNNVETLRMYGSRNVFFKLKSRFPEANFDTLLALEGAVKGINPADLDFSVRIELIDFLRIFD